MKLIEKLAQVPWPALWHAMKLLLILTGVGALIGWFAQPVPWWVIVPEVALLVAAFGACFLVVCWFHERREKRELERTQIDIDRRIARIRAGSVASGMHRRHVDRVAQPEMRRRFVYFDPKTGEPVTHLEAPGTV